jgi:acyl carrier protein
MTIGNLSSKQETKAMHQISAANDVRTIIAKHLGVEVKRVTDEAHLTYDLGADWLDRLELMIVIEDQFPAVEITDDDVDQIEVVGDLIHHIKRAWAVGDDDAPIIETPLQVISA